MNGTVAFAEALPMTGAWKRIKAAYRWLVGDDDTFVDLSMGFALFTVFSSVMMVTGHDTPKTGTFAYVHLLLRLSIIFGALALWDFDGVKADVKRALTRAKALPRTRPGHVIAWLRGLPDHPLTSACVLFTAATVLLCLVHILFVTQSVGGPALYLGLIWMFAVLYAVLLVWFALRRAARR